MGGVLIDPPRWRSVERPAEVGQLDGKLTTLKHMRPYLRLTRAGLTELDARVGRLRVEHPDRLPEALAHCPDGRGKVRVVRDHRGNIESVLEGVYKEFGREIDIRSLLLRLLHSCQRGRRVEVKHSDFRAEEVAEDDTDERFRTDGTQVDLLTVRNVWVIRGRANPRSKVSDRCQVVFRQKRLSKRSQVQPTMRTAADAVVEIESVDVDGGPAHGALQIRRDRLAAASHPAGETTGGIR